MEISVNDKRVKHWIEQAREDIVTARAMFRSKRWKYTIFMCQQSVEKYLKEINKKSRAKEILKKTEEVVKWIKKALL